ncbi:DUF1851 domain-containing protein [Microbulbifer sp. CAU 1566]|uniref:T6SS immunity protein Tdi1 domain-containing protein n=1 Tax=Microbulbifer sp. CAU 1566 TaxID=2933269 RepID=UPI002005ABA0|nr:T6SS immunity protein Tdi1 domain-containing protein [Microbulbifer sp. CAU 1566]MCK7598804.1 DUF1851 domain-containing protein [Microbulbifer sp. CAU 1566]
MTLNDLTVNFSHLEREKILSDWRWLIGDEKLPILITAFGEAFLQDVNDNSVHFLNVADGVISHIAASPEALKAKLSDKEFVSEFLAVQAVGDLRQADKLLEHGQVYSFKLAPALGGDITADNLEPSDIEVHFSVLGQIQEQVKNLPNGTEVERVEFQPSKKPWWKPWG